MATRCTRVIPATMQAIVAIIFTDVCRHTIDEAVPSLAAQGKRIQTKLGIGTKSSSNNPEFDTNISNSLNRNVFAKSVATFDRIILLLSLFTRRRRTSGKLSTVTVEATTIGLPNLNWFHFIWLARCPAMSSACLCSVATWRWLYEQQADLVRWTVKTSAVACQRINAIPTIEALTQWKTEFSPSKWRGRKRFFSANLMSSDGVVSVTSPHATIRNVP